MSLASGLKVFVAQTITAPWIGKVVRAVFGDRIPFRGVRVASRSPFVSPVVSAKLFWGIYEGAERRFVQSRLDPDLPVIELGSSIGGVSSHIGRTLAPGQRLICVEANPHLLPVLQKNLDQNAAHLDARAVHAAVSGDPRSVSFSISASSLSSSIAARDDALERITAPARKLSELVGTFGPGPYQLVMDIEGAEAGIVLDDAEALASCVRIVAELHATEHRGHPISVQDLTDAFKTLGFFLRDRHGPVVVMERAEPSA